MSDIEEERKQLRQVLRELLLVMGDIEKMGTRITALRNEAVELYKEIDAKLDGKESQNEHD